MRRPASLPVASSTIQRAKDIAGAGVDRAPRPRASYVVERPDHQPDVEDGERREHRPGRPRPRRAARRRVHGAPDRAALSHAHPGRRSVPEEPHGSESTDPLAHHRNGHGVSRIIVIGPSLTDATCMSRRRHPRRPSPRVPQRGTERLVQRLGHLGRRRRDPRRPPSLARVAIERELADHQHGARSDADCSSRMMRSPDCAPASRPRADRRRASRRAAPAAPDRRSSRRPRRPRSPRRTGRAARRRALVDPPRAREQDWAQSHAGRRRRHRGRARHP